CLRPTTTTCGCRPRPTTRSTSSSSATSSTIAPRARVDRAHGAPRAGWPRRPGSRPSSRTEVVAADHPIGCTGQVTELARRRPFRGWWRALRRSHDLVLAPDLPEGDVTRVVKAIDDVLDQRETNSQRAAAERVVGAYSRLDPAGRRRFLE